MIGVEHQDAVALVTLDRPERRNALDPDHCTELAAAVRGAADDGARAVVVRGAGDHFCAGADLTGIEGPEFAVVLREALDALRSVPVVTIAAVHGAALGAGTQLAVACDLRVAEADARFGIPAVKLGLMVDRWTVERLARLAGHGPAQWMLLAGRELSGADGHRLGFVQELGGIETALAVAASIAELAPLTIAGHKIGLNGGDPESYSAAFARAWASEDLVEGQAAFRERRPPRFQGR